VLLPVPADYDVPVFRSAKVHRDHHIEVNKALYSLPGDYIGQQVDIRADSQLVKVYHRRQLIKTHPTGRPGTRSTDPADLPAEKTAYALRDISRLIRICAGYGTNAGIYAERLLDDPLPWTRMRAVYRLIGLAKQYGPEAVDAACGKALDVDVIAVGKIASMLAKATEHTVPVLPVAAPAGAARFARDPSEYAGHRTIPANHGTAIANPGTAAAGHGTGPGGGRAGQLTLIPGGAGGTAAEGQDR